MAAVKAKFRFGLIGGGQGAFIGAVHRMAAELDSRAELVCGAFAADPDRSRQSGQNLYQLPAERCYGTFAQMFDGESLLPESRRMQFVIIAAPNHVHFPAAAAALKAGFHVVCDKPVTLSLAQAVELKALQGELKFLLTHNYTGYPMIEEARSLVAAGMLGKIRRAQASYLQGWLARDVDNKQASWRTDPRRAGAAGCFGDIGSHAENLLSHVTGLRIQRLCADLSTFVSGRSLDDDGNVLLQFAGGARGVISASQVACGCENDLSIKVYGDKAGLEWSQREPNSLIVRWPDKPFEIRRTGGAGLSNRALAAARLPAGHPEGYLEAFANLYAKFFAALEGGAEDYPGLEDGLRGMNFIEQVVASSAAGAHWVSLDPE